MSALAPSTPLRSIGGHFRMDHSVPTPPLRQLSFTDLLIDALSQRLAARRAELDALLYGTVRIEAEIHAKAGQMSFLEVSVKETFTKTDLDQMVGVT